MNLQETIAAKRKQAVGYDTLSGGRPFRPEPKSTAQDDNTKITFTLLDTEMPNRVVDKRPSLSIWMMSRVRADERFGSIMTLPAPLSLRTILEKGCTLACKDGTAYELPPLGLKPPIFLADHAVKSVIVRSMGKNGHAMSYDYMPPMFENICGSAACTRNGVSSEHLVKKSKTSFGTCHEVFTVHGNMTIREVRARPLQPYRHRPFDLASLLFQRPSTRTPLHRGQDGIAHFTGTD